MMAKKPQCAEANRLEKLRNENKKQREYYQKLLDAHKTNCEKCNK